MSRNQTRPTTLVAALAFYLDDCLVKGQSPRTVEVKKCSLNAFVSWCLSEGIRRPQQVGLAEVEDYQAYLFRYRQPYTEKPLVKATIRNRLTHVKVLFGCLYRRSFIKTNPVALMDLPRVPRQLPSAFLELPEMVGTLRQAQPSGPIGVRDRAILLTFYSTALRRMELANLDLPDIDLDKGIVTVRRGKGERDRRVPIAPIACEWIDAYLRYARPELQTLQSGQVLFLDNKGIRYRAHQLTRMAKKYVGRAGIQKRGACNLFRHSAATHMHENGADIRVVQEYLGHADISTTQIYSHVTINHLRRDYHQTHPAALDIH